MEGAPWDYGMELIPEDVDRIGDELSIGFKRYPELADVGIKRWVNGAFTFAPDGNPLVGPVGPRGYWVACGVMAGFSQGGGVGKSLAEWMVHGAAQADIFGMDVARFGLHQSNKEYIRQTTGQFYARRFVVTYPNEQLPAGRHVKLSGAYQDMDAAGARWGNVWGLEVPLYFADKTFEEPGTLRRPESFPIIAEECAAVEHAAGLLDISGFSRFRISGVGAKAWLDKLLACNLPEPGKVKLAPMLAEDGRLKGDLTCFNWGDGSYWLMGSFYLREFHMRWFRDHMGADVQIEDISDVMNGFSISGPNARKILKKISDTDIDDLKMMQCMTADLGLHRVRLARLSLSGDMAYEISCVANEHASLRKLLLQAGADLGLREIGFMAMLSMRLEKSIGIWNAEFTQGYTPAMTGLDRWIAWDKGDFVGKAAAQAAARPDRVLTMLEVTATNADCAGYEPVWKGREIVGITTSGGYGHRLGKSYALALVNRDLAALGHDLAVDVMGERRGAKTIAMSPYDPRGTRMKA
ncbi:Glycine cleavage system T protein (aminomethyltransferase) [Shimia gijangensis]|uniref:Glycine cleavage system T protein (Aminomethyltransferase) n=1 Tax=Shimia gijangensis TaxID=1470563 RepID=A0A1M6LJ07_9RHOB|nr:FAD-dependent oxidoreductase [Shimia gijangensis]SHJ71142.1 Glycine cleavage system T protein (aminomethyltransferase) [Shimia gijangensis]